MFRFPYFTKKPSGPNLIKNTIVVKIDFLRNKLTQIKKLMKSSEWRLLILQNEENLSTN